MTTYNTYQEAKIANQSMDVYKLLNMDGFVSGSNLGDLIRIHSLDTDAKKMRGFRILHYG